MPYQETQTKYVSYTIIFRTLDKGAHWEKFELPQTNMGTDLFFVNKDKGWVIIYNGMSLGQHPLDIYATNNGGKTWRIVQSVNNQNLGSTAISLNALISGIYFTDDQTGWLSGTTGMGYPVLLETTDGGVTWKDEEFPYQESYIQGNKEYSSTSSIRVDPPIFFNKTDGIIRIEYIKNMNNQIQYNSLFYNTSNGGLSWIAKGKEIKYKESDSFKYTFIDVNNGWLLNGKELLKTSDGGMTWITVNVATQFKRILNICFADKNNGWILDETDLFRTTDSGKSWKNVEVRINK